MIKPPWVLISGTTSPSLEIRVLPHGMVGLVAHTAQLEDTPISVFSTPPLSVRPTAEQRWQPHSSMASFLYSCTEPRIDKSPRNLRTIGTAHTAPARDLVPGRANLRFHGINDPARFIL